MLDSADLGLLQQTGTVVQSWLRLAVRLQIFLEVSSVCAGHKLSQLPLPAERGYVC